MIVSACDKVENIVGKGEIACKQFQLFPQCFQKVSFPDASKGVIVREWVKGDTSKCIFSELCAVFDLDFLPSIRHPTA